jgi:oligopeptide transport system ATP-binding protein
MMAFEEPAADRLLSVEDLRVEFSSSSGRVHAVNGISFELAVHETLGIVGESGCGKSVTSLAIMGLLPKPAGRIAGGQVIFDGTDLLTLKADEMRELRGRDLAMVFQDPMTSLNPVITIEEQLVEVIRAHDSKVSKAAAHERAIELLQLVGIPNAKERLRGFAHQLSGGMRQRVMIAIALALHPKLIIADEPTTALDVTIQAQILELIQRVANETGAAVMLITHDLGVVAGMTQRIQVMYAGRIVETATTGELFAHPRHPYTVGLLRSIPRLDLGDNRALIPIDGLPPDMTRERPSAWSRTLGSARSTPASAQSRQGRTPPTGSPAGTRPPMRKPPRVRPPRAMSRRSPPRPRPGRPPRPLP